MGTLRLKAPPPPAALAAIARVAGQPAFGSTVAQPASGPNESSPAIQSPAGHTPGKYAAARYAAAKALPRRTPEERAKAKVAKRVAAWYVERAARTEAGKQQAASRDADLALCRGHFPAVFDPDRPVPLAIGVRKPLAALVGVQHARRLLVWWTGRPEYLTAIAAGGNRYGLDGSIAGEIAAVHRAEARAALLKTRTPQPEREAA